MCVYMCVVGGIISILKYVYILYILDSKKYKFSAYI
jgi:hypothetical protein